MSQSLPTLRAEEARVKRGFWRKLSAALRHIPFAEEALAAYYCAFDPATPTRVRAVLIGALAYFIIPTDALPDFLPALGFTDDAAVLAAAIKTISLHVRDEHWQAAHKTLAELEVEER